MMIFSHVPGICKLDIQPFAARPTKGLRVVRVGRRIVGTDDNGRVFSDHSKKVVFGGEYIDDDLFEALRRLKVLTTEQIEAHTSASLAAAKARNLKYHARALRTAIRDAKVRATKEQRDFIATHAPEKESQP